MREPVRLAEFAALLAVAQDHAFGQTPGSQLRATVLARRLATVAGADPVELATVWWTSALRFLGCTGHTFELAALFGDEIGTRARSLSADPTYPAHLLREIVEHGGPGRTGAGRAAAVATLL